MSLLDSRANYESCVVYPEVTREDEDGNLITEASEVGVDALARFQAKNQSGTSARRSEQDNEGFETEKVYDVRFPRSFPLVLGAQSELEWRGERWVIFGDPTYHNGSPRTRHLSYTIKRY